MKRSICVFLFLLMFTACKVRHQSTTHRRERIRAEQTVLDSLSGRLLSNISAKRNIRARLSVFTPPDSLGRQAIHAVLDVDMGEETIRRDAASLQSTTSREKTVSRETVTSRETETNASLLSAGNIAAVLILVAAVAVGVRKRRW